MTSARRAWSRCSSGSVVLAYVGPDGTVVTQVIMGLQEFDARTGVLTPLPDTDKTGMDALGQTGARGVHHGAHVVHS